MPETFQLVTNPVLPITCHAFNKDRSQLALSPGNNEVQIYQRDGSGAYSLKFTLKEHTQMVTSIDWAPNTNRIVSCGQDRNAYVWTFEAGAWKPVLVILRINRSATCVRWSPNEDKFATGSGSRLISVSYFESDNNWWVSKHIKKPIRSTVLSISWHPNNILIAAGSSDFKARVFSGYVKEVEGKPGPSVWGSKLPFGELLAEFTPSELGGGWVHSVAFSPSGDRLLFVSHDSSVTFVDGSKGKAVSRVVSKDLPYRCCAWLDETTALVGGHDYVPITYTVRDGTLAYGERLDAGQKKEDKMSTAMSKFKTMDLKGTSDSSATSTEVDSTHQNAINEIRVFGGGQFSTVGNDGQLVLWP